MKNRFTFSIRISQLHVCAMAALAVLPIATQAQNLPEILPAGTKTQFDLRPHIPAPPPVAPMASHSPVVTLPSHTAAQTGKPLPHEESDELEPEDPDNLIDMWEHRRSPAEFRKLIEHIVAQRSTRDIAPDRRRLTLQPNALTSSAWSQVGVGMSSTDGVHHRAGRIRQATYAYDNSQKTQVLWLGATGGGLWKALSLIFAAVWVPVSDTLPGSPSVGAFLVQPGNSNNILIGTGDYYRYGGTGLYKTTDGGATWKLTSLSPAPGSFQKILADAGDSTHNTVLAQGQSGIWRSTDFGTTWKQVYSGSVTDLAQDPVHTYIWYAGIPGVGVYRSRSSGTSFPSSTKPSDGDISSGIGNTIGRVSLTMCPASPNYVYVLTEGAEAKPTFGTLGGIWRSGDYATHFTPIESTDKISGQAQGFHTCAIGVDPTNPDRLFCGMAGIEWTQNATANTPTWNYNADGGHSDFTSFSFQPNSTNVIITNDGGYYVFDYSSGTVSGTGNLFGLNCEQVMGTNGFMANSYSTPDMLLVGFQDNGMGKLNKNISPNISYFGGGDGGQCSIQPTDTGTFAYSSGAPYSRFYSSGGADWNNLDGAFGNDWTAAMLIDPTPGLTHPNIYTYADQFTNPKDPTTFKGTGIYYKPISTALDWKLIGGLLPANFHAKQMDASTNHGFNALSVSGLYVSGWSSGRLYVYEGKLQSMTYQDRTPPLPSGSQLSDCQINADKSAFQPNTVYYATGGSRPSRALFSIDRGAHWTDVTGDLATKAPNANYIKLLANPGDLTQLYLATDVGVFRSDNQGVNWYPYVSGLPAVESCNDITLNYDNANPPLLHLGTNGRGLWERQVASDAVLNGLTLNVSSIIGGNSVTSTLMLDRPAPAALVVSTRPSNPLLLVLPSTVTIPAGATSANFSIATGAVRQVSSLAVSATYNGVTVSAPLSLKPTGVAWVGLAPTMVVGGKDTADGTVTLQGPAPSGGINVTLSSNSTAATPSATSLVIASGATQGSFKVNTAQVSAVTTATITASANGTAQTASLQVAPDVIDSFAINPSTVRGGSTTTGTVTLRYPAPTGGVVVNIFSSRRGTASVPTSITIAAGATQCNFTIRTNRVPASTVVTIYVWITGVGASSTDSPYQADLLIQ